MMSTFLILAIAPLALCWALWLLFSLLALLPLRARNTQKPTKTITIDILIPAHDEELLLPRLLDSLGAQTLMAPIGRILVVADHCSDSTAQLARQWAGGGADVLERDTGPRGKPAALRDGLAYLKSKSNLLSNERAVLILDADCTLSPNLVERIHTVIANGKPVVQASYLLDCEGNSQRLHLPARIAFALKNVIRPRGMLQLGIPTQLFGTGMCFRADVLDNLTFDDHLTEDLAISHDLLLAGMAPTLVPDAVVRSPLPTERRAMTTQKLRWETGQVYTWTKLPGMLTLLLGRGWFRSAAALLDWSAPPVAMAVMYWMAISFAFVWCAFLRWTSPWLLLIPIATIALLATYVFAGAAQVAGIRGVTTLALSVPRFFFWKIAMYAGMLTGHSAKSWIRTPRDATPALALATNEPIDLERQPQIENGGGRKSKIENLPPHPPPWHAPRPPHRIPNRRLPRGAHIPASGHVGADPESRYPPPILHDARRAPSLPHRRRRRRPARRRRHAPRLGQPPRRKTRPRTHRRFHPRLQPRQSRRQKPLAHLSPRRIPRRRRPRLRRPPGPPPRPRHRRHRLPLPRL